MTIASDLATAHGIQRRLLLRIEGVEEELWQDDGTCVPPPAYSVPTVEGSLLSSDYDASDAFGYATAVNANTLAVGAPAEDGAGTDRGAVYVFLRTGTTWAEEQRLVASDTANGNKFGYAVALDGDTLAVSAPYAANGGTNRGQVYVFTRTGTTWTEKAILVPDDAANGDLFGSSLALDGATLLIGSPEADAGAELSTGAVYYYTGAGATWTQTQKIQIAGAATGDKLGQRDSVAICHDTGTTAIFGCKLRDVDGADAGRAYVYTLDGTWTLQKELIPADPAAKRYFGCCVDVDGNTAVVCAAPTSAAVDLNLTAYVFTRSGVTWSQAQRITVLQKSVTDQRLTAAVDAVAGLLVVGAPYEDRPESDAGYSALYYRSTGGDWRLLSENATYNQGSVLGNVSIDNTTAAVGSEDGTSPTRVYTTVKNWSRTGYACLLPPSEVTSEFDLAEMKAGLSAMTFEVVDFKDSDGGLHFAKLWGAPARWDVEPHYRLAAGTTYHQQINANATVIPVEYNDRPNAAGTIYVGRERIGYTSTNADAFIGCNRGEYAVIGSTGGYTIPQPQESDADAIPYVGTVPFTLAGARVGLYVTTFDRQTEAWNTTPLLLWAGRLDHSVRWLSQSGRWQLTATSVMQELDREICTNLASVVPCDLVTTKPIAGTCAAEWNLGTGNCYITEFEDGAYKASGVVKASSLLSTGLNKYTGTALTWVQYSGASTDWNLKFWPSETEPGRIVCKLWSAGANPSWSSKTIEFGEGSYHFLNAMGFGFGPFTITTTDTDPAGYKIGEIEGGENYFQYYCPLHPDRNAGTVPFGDDPQGNTLSVALIDNQEGTEGAFAIMRRASVAPDSDDGIALIRYTKSSGDLAVQDIEGILEPYQQGWMGFRAGEDPTPFQQVYVPIYKTAAGAIRGPYEMLLHSLLSTGTPGYNGTYDLLPYGWGLGIEEGLVDTQSFLDADTQIMASDLAHRRCYVIDKPIAWSELASREAKLFGFAPVWQNGKIKVVQVLSPAVDTWTTELGADNNYERTERPTMDLAVTTVVNRYVVKTRDFQRDKDEPTVTITDQDSRLGLGGNARAVEIEHPGLSRDLGTAPLTEMLKALFIGQRGRWMRYPCPVVERSLRPTLLRKVKLGNVVKLTSTLIPDPLGTGKMVTSCYALVTRVGWDYTNWRGTCQLVLLVTVKNYGGPWAPSAAVNGAGVSSGWDDANRKIYVSPREFGVSGDDNDGVRFKSGQAVVVVERSPFNANNPIVMGPYTLSADFDNTDHFLTLASGNLTQYNSALEWVVEFANWGDCSTAQRDLGTWQANATTDRFLDGHMAQRWGK